MNISELTTQEKSYWLAIAMGWRVDNLPINSRVWKRVIVDAAGNDLGLTPFGGGIERREIELKPTKFLDLYQSEQMALAWRVLNWADQALNRITYRLPMTYGDAFQLWWEESTVFDMPPAVAQAAWLDKVLQLAIEAGLVQP